MNVAQSIARRRGQASVGSESVLTHYRWLPDSADPIIRLMSASDDAMARKQQADLLLERTAMQLRQLLEEAAGRLRPFPPFPGAFFTNAIEVEAEAAESAEHGCIVVCEDGELYELKMSIDFSDDATDVVSARDEKLAKLEDLHPRDYIVLAYEALRRVTERLIERAEPAGPSGQESRGRA